VAAAGIRVYAGQTVFEAVPDRGKLKIAGAVLCPLDDAGQPQGGSAVRLDCDGIVMSVGWAPAGGTAFPGGGPVCFGGARGRVRPALAAGERVRGWARERYLQAGGPTRRRTLRRAGGGEAPGSIHWINSAAADPHRPTARSPLSDLRSPQEEEFRRSRRGPAPDRLRQRAPGRLRQHRAAQALHDRRHGAQPGQACEHERGAHPGPAQREDDQRDGHDDLAAVSSAGVDGATGGPPLPSAATDADPRLAPAGGGTLASPPPPATPRI